jgi:hypothetical protein
MARSAIPVTISVKEGVVQPSVTSSDATNKHYIANNDGRIILEINNTNAGTQTVTFLTSRVLQGLPVTNLIVSLTTGQIKYAGPFPTDLFNQTYTTFLNCILIDPSVTTDIKFRAIQVPSPSRSQ